MPFAVRGLRNQGEGEQLRCSKDAWPGLNLVVEAWRQPTETAIVGQSENASVGRVHGIGESNLPQPRPLSRARATPGRPLETPRQEAAKFSHGQEKVAHEEGVRPRPASLVTIVFMGMVLADVLIPTLGVMAPFLVNEFHLSATELGVAAAGFGIVGGLTAPGLGHASDRFGPRGALTLLLATSAAAMMLAAASIAGWVLILAMALAGLGQGIATPATNAAVSELISPDSWGFVTGIKEAGVPAGALIAGMVLPPVGVAGGWRVGFLLIALASSVTLIAVNRLLTKRRVSRSSSLPIANQIGAPTFVKRLALYGFFVGFWHECNADLSATVRKECPRVRHSAGWPSGRSSRPCIRHWKGRLERIDRTLDSPRIQLMTIAGLARLATVLLAISDRGPSWLVWIGAAVFGLSAFAWTSVGAMAVMRRIPRERIGSATGRVILGFGLVLGLGPIVFGFLVDTSKSYLMSLVALAILYFAAMLTMSISGRAFDAVDGTLV